MIKNNKELLNFLSLIKEETELAIDTEFKWVSTYYPILCLIQIATKDMAECIDVMAIEDLEPLFDKLYQPDVLWIAHAARNDVEVLYRVSGRLPARVFDTQIAVDLLQHLRLEGSTGGQISYQAITEILQGVILEKTYTRLDWSVRPLPEGAVQYALDDVVYLIRNYAQLKTLLESEGKLDWLMEDGQAMLDIHIYNPNIFQSWTRVKGFNRLPKHLHNLGVQLAGWREQTAIKKNKPRRWILSDDDLINIAMEKRHLSNDKQQNFDNFIAKNPCNIEIDTSKRVPTAEEKSQKLILQKLIQEKANQYNLNAEVITNGKTLLRYIRNDRSVNFLSGWRYDLLKEELEKCKTV
ncbi:MAG: Ribonuclease D [Catillopecten margaritatus gill symbiont]|uniref:Ribonuclease D n=1 Tax=Catillopecten margaritatus gill symbiont TaxID=3083288 RepID=A0AAU6PI63_9GAMM